HRGLVYRFSLADNSVGAVIPIEPVTDTGFVSTADGTATTPAGCFTNQLYSATVNNGKLFVTSVCESPRGPTGARTPTGGTTPDPRNFQAEIFSVVAEIDLATNTEIAANKLVLQRNFAQKFMAASTPAAEQRMPLLPLDITFVPGTQIAYLVGYGS